MNVQENLRNVMSDQILVMYARAYEYQEEKKVTN